jgi:5-methylthioadenosine/S-adenosylhomocysteine deaminase
MLGKILIKDAQIITLDGANRILEGSLAIADGVITALLPSDSSRDLGEFDEIIDGRGKTLLPGFVQTHIHLCQTLFRGFADDLALIDWLKQRIWPMEAAHTHESLYASAQLGIAELIRGGTTCALTMETVNHTEAVFQAIEESGFRATAGKCMMDHGEDLPDALHEKTEDSLVESLRLLEQWHGRANGRIRYCFAPRFAVSCTRELLEQVAVHSRQRAVMVHTHASENLDEVAMVERSAGKRNIEYLRDVGLTAPHVLLAHCIHLDDKELQILRETGTHVAHCPSSNLKLASGIARVEEMLELGISVSLGADGAPCNNRLDIYTEMRTAALLQKVLRGSRALSALTALRMATIYGARAMGLADRIGSIEVGKSADLQLIDLDRLHTTPHPDIISTIVYAAQASDVQTVIIDGMIVMRDRELTTLDEKEVIAQAHEQASYCRSAINERGRR